MADVLKSFDTQKTLNPNIWLNAESDDFAAIKLSPDVRKRLIAIATLFMESIKIKNLTVEDIIFTGSLANYNWSEYSDIDLHVIVDKSKLNIDSEVLDDYLTVKKDAFNTRHQIKLKTYDVEMYVQDTNEELAALGIYSVLSNRWIKTPVKEHIAIDKANIRKKVKTFIRQIAKIEQLVKSGDSPNEVLMMIRDVKERIKKYRKSGLATGGEYSDENLVFKYLRRKNYLQKLTDDKIQVIDRMFSLQEVD
jgi:predicted nucleotidyltransferase